MQYTILPTLPNQHSAPSSSLQRSGDLDSKMKLSDLIWGEQMAIPQSHQDLVMERLELLRHNPDRLSDWDDAVKTLK